MKTENTFRNNNHNINNSQALGDLYCAPIACPPSESPPAVSSVCSKVVGGIILIFLNGFQEARRNDPDQQCVALAGQKCRTFVV